MILVGEVALIFARNMDGLDCNHQWIAIILVGEVALIFARNMDGLDCNGAHAMDASRTAGAPARAGFRHLVGPSSFRCESQGARGVGQLCTARMVPAQPALPLKQFCVVCGCGCRRLCVVWWVRFQCCLFISHPFLPVSLSSYFAAE